MSAPPRHPTDRESLERDCDVEYFRGGGPGGQHRNKSETGVRLRHGPTGTVVVASERRSRTQNLENAYDRMAERLEEMQQVDAPRHNTRPTRASVERRLQEKRRKASRKSDRRYRHGDD